MKIPNIRKSARANLGFTVMELLVVVAIIAVLIGISVPVFTRQVDQARLSTDKANARSAYAAATAEYMNEGNTGTATYYFNAETGAVSKDVAGIEPYGQYDGDADYDVGGVAVNGNASVGGILQMAARDGQITSISWGAAFSLWSALTGTTINSDVWYKPSTQREEAFNTLISTDNASRKAADLEIIDSLANYFNGMSADEAKKILGDTRYNKIVNQHGDDDLFKYTIDGGGSIRINSLDTSYQPYFTDLGYKPRIYDNSSVTDTYAAKKNNYTDKYLFTSNEMVGTRYASNTEHSVKIKFNVGSDGKIFGTQVWVPGLTDQGYKSGS